MVLNNCQALARRKKPGTETLGKKVTFGSKRLTKNTSVGKADIILLWLNAHGEELDTIPRGKRLEETSPLQLVWSRVGLSEHGELRMRKISLVFIFVLLV